MALLISIIILSIFPLSNNAEAPPSPGYYPTSRLASIPFNQAFTNLWGPQHQSLDQDGSLTIWLDQTSGSGFKSLDSYSSGYFGASIKLQPGYTAGVITSLYLSNNEELPGKHDEIDIEFLGTTEEEAYVLQTNVYIRGSGDGHIIGREIKFHLWFDPTTDFHNYAILWNPSQIIFYVDDVPIRRYPRKSDATFPMRPMWLYGSIWDASSWATDNGRYKADYTFQPFIGKYNNFKIDACAAPNAAAACRPISGSPPGSNGLSRQQRAALAYVHHHYKLYDYCRDPQRDHKLTPEC
ncbi:probable xyloglucan endotransglucosylase/hydrolase protein 32 [Salvia miltiorrhiza]|uniref:probable xyloglucan endotransglucosylase/hydrolase protein 32 n=1 Tax=Salvia miltiorrhiza TaxID=226208 RepID=UPI0025AB8901|nr:probable xyloglucan endotransglucosylase/hydrolase protein 32 [Salvia miltiorrhiza]